jgi:hypothetical protein
MLIGAARPGLLAQKSAEGLVPLVPLGSGISGTNTTDNQTSAISEAITLPEGTTLLIWAASANNGDTTTPNTDHFANVEYNGEEMVNLIPAQEYLATMPAWTVWGLRKPAGFDTSEHNLTADRTGGGLSAHIGFWFAVGGSVHEDICETPAVSTPSATNTDPRTIALTALNPNSIVFAGAVSQGADTDPMTATNDLDQILQTTDSGGGSATADVGAAIGIAEIATPDDYVFGFDAAASDGGQIFALEIIPG